MDFPDCKCGRRCYPIFILVVFRNVTDLHFRYVNRCDYLKLPDQPNFEYLLLLPIDRFSDSEQCSIFIYKASAGKSSVRDSDNLSGSIWQIRLWPVDNILNGSYWRHIAIHL